MLKLSDFDYELPKELIAQYPLVDRESARMLVLDRGKKTITHRIFKDLADYLEKDDLLVLNNTKVLRARLIGSRLTTGKVELLLLRQKSGLVFDAMIKPARVRLGEKIKFSGGNIFGIVSARNEITFHAKDTAEIYNLGVMPLPPYIKRIPNDADNIYYQTVYAKEEGAIAAPTAGLHFSQEALEDIEAGGVKIAYLTLHVGEGTFKPIKCDDITQHKMEPEYFEIPEDTKKLLRSAKTNHQRVIAVGTTSLRALETFACGTSNGHTDLFIYPGYKFSIADCLLTNFHLPRTTLFMLACAFGGEKLIRQAYQEAIEQKYRFYSYGDAMLIL